MEKLLIIDAYAVIYRAFYALPKLVTKKGEIVNALYGFLLVFLKEIKDLNPDYIVACFDSSKPTFRHKEFRAYKAQRPETPKDLSDQIPKVKKILEMFSVPIFEKQGFEADDIIATLAFEVNSFKDKEHLEVVILSGDLYLLQLAKDNIKICVLQTGVNDAV